MRSYAWIIAVSVLAATTAAAQDGLLFKKKRTPPCAPCPPAAEQPSPLNPNVPLMPPSEQRPPAESPFQEALASAQEAGTQPAASRNPGFFGDVLGPCTQTTVSILIPGVEPFRRNFTICSPDASLLGVKVSETDSPRPVDRIYYQYNMYGAITLSPDPTVPLLDVHRHLIGFEKTLLGGDASIGMRLPIFSFAGSEDLSSGFAGDLTIIAKYALINDLPAGNVLSGGLLLTAPTGGSPHYAEGFNGVHVPSPRNFPVLLQPWGGYVYNILPRIYLHGFHGIVVSTDINEPNFLTNDVGLGFWVYRDPQASFIRAFVPTFEVHVNTPLDHRETPTALGQVQMLDTVNLTTGFYILMPRAMLGGAVGIPLNGPNQIEAIASVTVRF
jgi:hypothetical protein